jgi:hypothetical protein
MRGTPWVDFEWLAQVVMYGTYAVGGLAGLWLLKVVGLACVGRFVWLGMPKEGAQSLRVKAVFFTLWAAAIISRSDIRTELFSLAAFSWLLYRLEEQQRGARSMPAPGWVALLFAVWANFHAGFLYGIVLLFCYAVFDAWLRRDRQGIMRCTAAVLGTLVNPFGAGVYWVLARHALESGGLASYIDEWGPLSWSQMSHWPVWAAAAVLVFLWVRRLGRKGKWSAAMLSVSVLMTAGAIKHSRLSAYLAICAAVYGYRLFKEDKSLSARADKNFILETALVLFIIAACVGNIGAWQNRLFNPRYTPARASEFIAKNPGLSSLRMYNAWGWGGYLGWRLGDQMQVFQDGRYIFHPLLIEAGSAARSAKSWDEYLGRYDIDAVLLQNRELRLPSTRVYPDGSERVFHRPYYVSYMPKEKWALLYWDEKSLLFVLRSALQNGQFPAEYRLYRPRDGEALGDAVSRGEIEMPRLILEQTLHQRQLKDLAASLPRALQP